MFYSLRPPNVLLLTNSLKDQCKCTKISFLTYAVGITYIGDVWNEYLCNTDENSACWLGDCIICESGKKIVVKKPLNKIVSYRPPYMGGNYC